MGHWYKAVLGIIKERFIVYNWKWEQSFCSIAYRFTVVNLVAGFYYLKPPNKVSVLPSKQSRRVNNTPNCGLDQAEANVFIPNNSTKTPLVFFCPFIQFGLQVYSSSLILRDSIVSAWYATQYQCLATNTTFVKQGFDIHKLQKWNGCCRAACYFVKPLYMHKGI